ncbi:MAG: hypothetical protein K2P35_02735 [Lachnospiraceae bacterium]|nr:hypothetical protein [Lachnospiraceae bacterium]
MKAKYILRGLGLGMIITAVVLGAYTRSAVADARVAILKEYGIGEESVLAETLVDVEESGLSEEENENVIEPSVGENVVPDTIPYNEELESEIQSALDAAETMEQGGQADVSDAASGDDLGSQQEETESQDMSAAEEQGNAVTIEILKGDDSGTVARKLYNAGIVENAAEYDAFLMQHGYDKRLNPGVKTIYAADSWQDIAEKLAKK